MEETKYYVFDCDTDLYKLSQKINKIFKEFQRKNSRNIYICYGYSEMAIDDKCYCNLLTDDTISLIFGYCDITFRARGKVLKLSVSPFKTLDELDYYMKIEVIDKG